MALTTEQLMKPRYKVISDYPNSLFEVGEVISLGIFHEDAKQYPAIFQPLGWWEERSVDDLPEYAKVINYSLSLPNGYVGRVVEWISVKGIPDYMSDWLCRFDTKDWLLKFGIGNLLPATESEYKSYKASTP